MVLVVRSCRHPLRRRQFHGGRFRAARGLRRNRDHRHGRSRPGVGDRRCFPLGPHPGRSLRSGVGRPIAAPRFHPAPLPPELRVLHLGRLDRHPFGRPLRHQPDPYRRHGGIRANGHAVRSMGITAPAGQRRGTQPGPVSHRQRRYPGHHHRGLDAHPGPSRLPGVGRGDLPDLRRRGRGRPPHRADQDVAGQLPPAGPGGGRGLRWDGRRQRPAAAGV